MLPVSGAEFDSGYGAGSGWDMGSNGISEPMPMTSWGNYGGGQSGKFAGDMSVGGGYGMPAASAAGYGSRYSESGADGKGISMTLSVGGSGYGSSNWPDSGQHQPPPQMLDDSSGNYPLVSGFSVRTMRQSAQSDYGPAPTADTSAETMTANDAGW